MIMTSRGLALLKARLPVTNGGLVTYTRGTTTAAGVSAIVGRTDVTVQPQVGESETVYGDRDYIIAVDQLLQFATPVQGDKITDNGVTYEVLTIPGQAHWRYTDGTKLLYRIHTKRKA